MMHDTTRCQRESKNWPKSPWTTESYSITLPGVCWISGGRPGASFGQQFQQLGRRVGHEGEETDAGLEKLTGHICI